MDGDWLQSSFRRIRESGSGIASSEAVAWQIARVAGDKLRTRRTTVCLERQQTRASRHLPGVRSHGGVPAAGPVPICLGSGGMSGLLRPVGPADLLGSARAVARGSDGACYRCRVDHQWREQWLGSSTKSTRRRLLRRFRDHEHEAGQVAREAQSEEPGCGDGAREWAWDVPGGQEICPIEVLVGRFDAL